MKTSHSTHRPLRQHANALRRTLVLACCLAGMAAGKAQLVEGTTYYLPKTALRFTLLVERTDYTPGQLAGYAKRYMKKDVEQQASTTHRLIDLQMMPVALPDTAKRYVLSMERRLSINSVARSDEGILLAINTEPKSTTEPAHFTAARKPAPLVPQDYMNEDILTAGSTAKMASLIAQEIYDIRDSRYQLQRGQADNMPTDGQQLRIMMDGLDTQERALRQVFEGTTVKDTAEVVFDFVPTEATEQQLLFRFSRHFGLVEADDLSGEPFYVSVTPEQPATATPAEAQKKLKDDIGLNVNLPVRTKVTLTKDAQTVADYTLQLPQLGKTENLSGALFGRKQTCQIVLNPLTGAMESIREVMLEKQ